MNKKLLVFILAFIAFLMSVAMFIYYDATFLAPHDYKASYLTVNHPDTSASGFRILYMTDLEYGTYTDETNLKEIALTVRSLDYDLLIFGGDLFDQNYTPEGKDLELLTSFFRELIAPAGKFAIFGDFDLISESRKNITNKILTDSGFEILNDSIRIYLSSSRYFYLSGFDFDRQVEKPLSQDHLNLAVIHSLEIRAQLSDADLILCGHSHSMQINRPFSNSYKLGYHQKDKLYYSSGLGMTRTAHRLFCDPEVVIIILD